MQPGDTYIYILYFVQVHAIMSMHDCVYHVSPAAWADHQSTLHEVSQSRQVNHNMFT